MARVFAIVSSSRDSANDIAVLCGLQVLFLDRDWAAQRVLPIHRELPGRFAWLQLVGIVCFPGKLKKSKEGFDFLL